MECACYVMTEPGPIFVASLFREVTERLLTLLRSLAADDWQRPTVSSQRKVKDIAAHLLDGSLRRLSMQRDGYRSPDGASQPRTDETVLDFLNRLNAEWELAARRLSPQVLIDLIEWADGQLADLFESLDPYGPAIFPVAWAGEEKSLHWMDVARDYSEKWHHTQQIFVASGRPSTITERRLFHPCLDILLRALPFTLRNVSAADGTVIAVTITGDAGGDWFVVRSGAAWVLQTNVTAAPAALFSISQDSAWQLFTKRLDRTTAQVRFPDLRLEGDRELAGHVIDMVSVMA
jgi:uncharacterized protein (TIGR03083 family)